MLVSIQAFASQSFTMKTEGKDKSLKIVKLEGVNFSKDCEKKKCQAYKTYKSPKKVELKPSALAGNPASKFCGAQGGTGIILRDDKNRQYDFCRFEDESLVDAWGLYENR